MCVCIRAGIGTRAAAADPRVFGSQAFSSASAFNANIGAWNTASVTTLEAVRAASGPRAPAAGALWSVFGVARPLCAAAAPMCVCARERVRAHVAVHANVCERLTPPIFASSARRRSPRCSPDLPRRRSSTRTSARGTPRESRRCPRYAPLSARVHRGGRASVGLRRGAAVVCSGATDVRARVRACACAGSCSCKGVWRWIAHMYTHVLVCHRALSMCVIHRCHTHTCMFSTTLSGLHVHTYSNRCPHRARASVCVRMCV